MAAEFQYLAELAPIRDATESRRCLRHKGPVPGAGSRGCVAQAFVSGYVTRSTRDFIMEGVSQPGPLTVSEQVSPQLLNRYLYSA